MCNAEEGDSQLCKKITEIPKRPQARTFSTPVDSVDEDTELEDIQLRGNIWNKGPLREADEDVGHEPCNRPSPLGQCREGHSCESQLPLRDRKLVVCAKNIGFLYIKTHDGMRARHDTRASGVHAYRN